MVLVSINRLLNYEPSNYTARIIDIELAMFFRSNIVSSFEIKFE